MKKPHWNSLSALTRLSKELECSFISNVLRYKYFRKFFNCINIFKKNFFISKTFLIYFNPKGIFEWPGMNLVIGGVCPCMTTCIWVNVIHWKYASTLEIHLPEFYHGFFWFSKNKMPSVRLELTTFRLWDWRANQLRQEGFWPRHLTFGS